MKKKPLLIALITATVLLLAGIVTFIVLLRPQKVPVIEAGETSYNLGRYDLQKEGLVGLEKILRATKGLPPQYNVSYFNAELDRRGLVQSFTLSLDTYDESGTYYGGVSYLYRDKTITYTETTSAKLGQQLAFFYDQNATLSYLDGLLKQIPIKKQIAVSGLSRYFVGYRPHTVVQQGNPIFDLRAGDAPQVLGPQDYADGKGGVSDGKTSVVITLYDGSSMVSGQLFQYVFAPADADTALGDRTSHMQCDYMITGGQLRFSYDYGSTWVPAPITEQELKETMDFYQDRLALPSTSLFMPVDPALPTAYFWGKTPVLTISTGQGGSWQNVQLPLSDSFERSINKRAVGFVSSSFGWAALGTDWSMGGGEHKACYFTRDGGQSWEEKALPMQGSSRYLRDMAMATEQVGAVALDAGNDVYYPLLFVTDDTGDSWAQIELPYDQIPTEKVQYLTDIDSFQYAGGQYTLVLGQGDAANAKVTFTSTDLHGGWKLQGWDRAAIHTVG
ncbi:Uncharacterized protein related to plant photosystem II stability/assembly factor [Anaerotruncus sp. 2789STDY5834896]|uniref:Uncharacterized protein related to plant photosystem II stability/assembly factor n=1 Tax=uncultured Anaerotruncus sp. TaxID=905011 RepID=A0A1C6FZJ2_9FIRM|nr:Uncharacterized protein related to plant photosystem II stability/assembly factor [uncultured Anaerotruncus sp.]